MVIACSSDDDEPTPAGTPAVSGTLPAATNTQTTGGQATGEAAQVEAAMRSAVDAYTKQNLTEFLSYWTDNGLMDEFESSRADLQAAGPGFFEGPPLALRSLSNTQVSGDKASTEAELAFGIGVEKTKYSFVRQNNSWKIDSGEAMKPAVPSGATAIDVTLDEFSFTFDKSKLSGGNVAFNLKNVGDQPHEMVLIQSPDSFGLNQLLQLDPSADLPAGVEFVTAAGPIEPGKDGRVVFTQKLSGHYLMVCFLPDLTVGEDGPPHFSKGMAVEFTVPAQ